MSRPRAGGLPLVACAVVLAGLAACGGGHPAEPSGPPAGLTYSLTGLVTDSKTGSAVAGAIVSIFGGAANTTALTDAQGNFAFTGLQATVYSVSFTASGYVAQTKSVNLTSNQTLWFRVSRPEPGAGVSYDNIEVAHQFLIGTPIPTQNQATTYCCWPYPTRNTGSYTFDLAEFPLDVLPSGGNSNILSASEMIIVGINMAPASGTMRFQWHKAVNVDSVFFTITGQSTWTWMSSYVGRFSWEINEPGNYYVLIETPSGNARLNFVVVDSSGMSAAQSRSFRLIDALQLDRNSPTGGVIGGR